MAKKSFKTVNIDELAFDKLSHLCDTLNMTKTGLLELLIENVFEITSNLRKGAGIMFDTNGNQLIVQTYGKPIVVSGMFHMDANASDREIDYEVKKRVEKELGANKNE